MGLIYTPADFMIEATTAAFQLGIDAFTQTQNNWRLYQNNLRLYNAWEGAAVEALNPRKPEQFDPKTAFDIPKSILVSTESISPFCNLHHFEHARSKPSLTFVLPNSGKSGSVGRYAVESFLPDFNVHMVEWVDPRLVPLTKDNPSQFDLEDLTDNVLTVMRRFPNTTFVGTSQSGLPVIVAASLLSMDNDPAKPSKLALMGSPLNPGIEPTGYTLAAKLRMSADHLSVRERNGRLVVPGEVMEAAFTSLETHKPFRTKPQPVTLAQIRQTLDRVFERHLLAEGRYEHRGRLVDPSAFQGDVLVGVSEFDKIVPNEQTRAARSILSNAKSYQEFEIPKAGHYDIVGGPLFQEFAVPAIRRFVLEAKTAKPH